MPSRGLLRKESPFSGTISAVRPFCSGLRDPGLRGVGKLFREGRLTSGRRRKRSCRLFSPTLTPFFPAPPSLRPGRFRPYCHLYVQQVKRRDLLGSATRRPRVLPQACEKPSPGNAAFPLWFVRALLHPLASSHQPITFFRRSLDGWRTLSRLPDSCSPFFPRLFSFRRHGFLAAAASSEGREGSWIHRQGWRAARKA